MSGQITEVRVVDNQYVQRGDVLYVIDPFDFQVALDMAKAQLREKAADLQVKRMQAERRQHLSDLATTPEEQQQYVGNATQAQAAFDAAQQQVAQADVNLQRTQVRAPVNGYVTNLLMRVGDYAHAGATNISVIDADSYWIDGYFEETKMAHICIGDRAEAQLMGYSRSDRRTGPERDPRHQRLKRRAEHPRPAERRSGLHLGAAGATRAGSHPDHGCPGGRPARFGHDCDHNDPRRRGATKR